MIDFPFEARINYAVRCRTPEEVRLFLTELARQYNVEPDIEFYATIGHQDLGDKLTFRVHVYNDDEIGWGWDSCDYYESAGYKMLECSDLIRIADLGEIEPDLNIAFLFAT